MSIKNDGYAAPITQEQQKKDYIDSLSKKYDDLEVVSYNTFKNDMPSFVLDWFESISRYGNIGSCWIFFKSIREAVRIDEQTTYKAKCFTNDHEYTILLILRNPEISGYIGGFVNKRKSKVGETWNRGSDISDGKFIPETLIKIEKDIVSYELKNLQLTHNPNKND